MSIEKSTPTLSNCKVHFIGVGGIGMCGIAEILLRQGAQVSGSDCQPSTLTHRLEKLGLKFFDSHRTSNLGDADVVVVSSAISSDNPERKEAQRRGIPLISRAEALAEVSRLKRSISIAGSHGKTTTTSLLTSSLMSLKLDPMAVVGGRLLVSDSTIAFGAGSWMVAEADESDGSFQRLSPEIAIITNIDNDHLDFYGSMTELEQAFAQFADRVPFYGLLVACGDDPRIKKMLSTYQKPFRTYGFSADNDYRILSREPVSGAVSLLLPEGQQQIRKDLQLEESQVWDLVLPLPGDHFALNAVAVAVVLRHLGFSCQQVNLAFSQFQGVDRRFHFQGEFRGAKIYDDYGHHPTEIRATLKAMKERYPKEKLIVFFQPHRYSRTHLCWQDFLTAFSSADEVFVTDIYPAGEAPLEGIDSKRLAQQIQHSKVIYQPRQIWTECLLHLKEGDVFLFLGAGDIYEIPKDIRLSSANTTSGSSFTENRESTSF